MADPPRLTKLGAKWVEVRKRRGQGFRSGMWGRIENVASNTRWRKPAQAWRGCPKLVGVASFDKREQPGSVSHPRHCRLWIAVADFEGVPLSSSNVVIGW